MCVQPKRGGAKGRVSWFIPDLSLLHVKRSGLCFFFTQWFLGSFFNLKCHQKGFQRSQHMLGIVLEGFFCLHNVTFFKTLMADYEHFLRWVTCFNWFLWSIMPSGDGNTKFWTRHLRFSTRKLPLNMGYFEVFNYFFIFCISFLCFKIDLNHLELLYCTCSICGNLSPLYLCFHLWFKKEIIPYSSAICVALM